MSTSPRRSTAFSVSDILSPMEDGYHRLGGPEPPPLGAYRQAPQHHHHHHLSSSSSPSSAALAPGGQYHVAHAVPQFSGSLSGFCGGGIGNLGELPPYQDSARSGGAAAAWYGGPEPRYPPSKATFIHGQSLKVDFSGLRRARPLCKQLLLVCFKGFLETLI